MREYLRSIWSKEIFGLVILQVLTTITVYLLYRDYLTAEQCFNITLLVVICMVIYSATGFMIWVGFTLLGRKLRGR